MAGVRVDGDLRRLRRSLAALGELEFKKANQAIGQILRTSTIERFRQGKDPDGKKWETSKLASAEGRKTLIDSARLRNSIKTKATNKGVAVGTNTIYAATHQFGDEGRTIKAKGSKGLVFNVNGQWRRKKVVKVTIPARPFLGVTDEDMAEIKATLNRIVEEATQ